MRQINSIFCLRESQRILTPSNFSPAASWHKIMCSKTILCVLLLLVSMAHGKMATTGTYVHSATLRTGNIKLYWNFTDTDIVFEVHGQTTGWIGLGFSPYGAMAGADIIVGWVKYGEIKVTDRHGVGHIVPPLDPRQDINVLGGAECDGWTMFKFSRQLASCEARYDREISQNTERLIFAWGDEDPEGHDLKQTNYHGAHRGVESIYFLQHYEAHFGGLPGGPTYKTFDLRMDQFEMPAVSTYHTCKIFRVPKLDKRHHIVKYEPVQEGNNEQYVHHMVIERCSDVMEDPGELLKDSECSDSHIKHLETCDTMILSWAVGAGDYHYPEDAGLSIGGEGDPVYLRLEIHYDNPTLKSGIIDSSGIRFTYTDSLRKHDVGILLMGVDFSAAEHFIPPGVESFRSVGHCTSDSGRIMKASDVEDISVFGVTLHSHLAGRSMKLRHIRDGTELPPPAYDEHYDYNYQETRYLVPHVTMKPEDNLQMDCIYNTKERKDVTEEVIWATGGIQRLIGNGHYIGMVGKASGGHGVGEEMCLAYLTYYPKIDLGQCLSSVAKKDSLKFFGVHGDIERKAKASPTSLASWILPDELGLGSKNMLEYLNAYNWNTETSGAFEAYYNAMPHYVYCTPFDATKLEVFSFNVTEIKSPYVEPRTCCDPASKPLVQSMDVTKCPGSKPRLDFLLAILTLLLMITSIYIG